MCRSCWALGADFFEEEFYGDGFGFGYGGHPRAGGAAVSQRAMNACETAKKIFLNFLATTDTSKGNVTQEIVQFHLVPDMKKAFGKYVKDYHCQPTFRKLTREEQNRVNPNRKSLMTWTAVTVTPAAQADYINKNPKEAEAARAKHTAGSQSSAKAESAASSSKSAPAPREPLASKKRNVSEAGLSEANGNGAKKAKAT